MNINKIIKRLESLVKKAESMNEVPIAALIIKDDKIIASAYNTVEKDNSVLSHAEIKCIKKASKILNNWRLDDCELYVTLEPCDMCREIIKKSRIKKAYYFVKQNEYVTEKESTLEYIENNYFSKILSEFFKNHRK